MDFNLTVNECDTNCPTTPGNYNVRAHYNETDAGHVYGIFKTREKAEACLLVLSARSDVVKATIENA